MDMTPENQMRMERPQGHGQQSYRSVLLGVREGAPYACLPPTSLATWRYLLKIPVTSKASHRGSLGNVLEKDPPTKTTTLGERIPQS